MPAKSDDPLRRVTLNLYEDDCAWFEREYGHGWSERVRQHIHYVVTLRKHEVGKEILQRRRTLGDLADDWLRYNKEK